MNQKTRRLSEQLVQRETMRENLIKSQKKSLKEFDEETERLNNRLENTLRNCNPQTKATKAWCRITNALIHKYKPLTETLPTGVGFITVLRHIIKCYLLNLNKL